MTSLNLALSSLRVRLWLMSSAWLMATERAYEICWSGVEAWSGSVLVVADVCSTCFHASTSEQLLSAWIWRAAFSVANLGQCLLEGGCEPLQFRHLGLSEFGHVSLLWPGVAHVWHTSSLALQTWNYGRISDIWSIGVEVEHKDVHQTARSPAVFLLGVSRLECQEKGSWWLSSIVSVDRNLVGFGCCCATTTGPSVDIPSAIQTMSRR